VENRLSMILSPRRWAEERNPKRRRRTRVGAAATCATNCFSGSIRYRQWMPSLSCRSISFRTRDCWTLHDSPKLGDDGWHWLVAVPAARNARGSSARLEGDASRGACPVAGHRDFEHPIKKWFRRRRPFVSLIEAIIVGRKPGSYSFPSGPSAAATNLIGAIRLQPERDAVTIKSFENLPERHVGFRDRLK
jgi:hypothetical protein